MVIAINKKKIAVSFSGKDSTLALHDLLHSGEFEVVVLIASVTEGYNRTSIHGVRVELLEAQATSIGLPLKKIWIPENCSNEKYQEIMTKINLELKEQGIEYIAFGDLFLEDVRKYREDMLKPLGIKPIFPLWGEGTSIVIERFISLGYKTIITCVDLTRLSEEFSGKEIDSNLINDLPKEVDPCGENGEYHSFVFDGPIFNHPIDFNVGEKKLTADVYTGETRFCFTDLVLA
ncbi:diphthine--ammonia ligase [Bacillus sp. AFS055030]|uniref:Dph6-related ATP pyrophosphatase n=1 Tax=Bacillus sp. AFS055030 TaxID=2033507 RepID=UPI000BFDA849|nr:diphthine--ammonia ligase [Bacillus sp. AFS055030]PGL71072.1 ATP-binding protein [Bacillus sp. AFS055030]